MCPCGADHTDDKVGSLYFVTCRDAGRVGFAAGPYPTHAAALADLEEVRTLAEELDGYTFFYSWGTCRIDGEHAPKEGVMNARLAARRTASESSNELKKAA